MLTDVNGDGEGDQQPQSEIVLDVIVFKPFICLCLATHRSA